MKTRTIELRKPFGNQLICCLMGRISLFGFCQFFLINRIGLDFFHAVLWKTILWNFIDRRVICAPKKQT